MSLFSNLNNVWQILPRSVGDGMAVGEIYGQPLSQDCVRVIHIYSEFTLHEVFLEAEHETCPPDHVQVHKIH